MVHSAQGLICVNKEVINFNVEIRSVKMAWKFQIIEGLIIVYLVLIISEIEV